MSNLTDLINQQKTLKTQLNGEIENFKKEPKERLARIERLQSWIPRINGPYATIKGNHRELLQHHTEQIIKLYIADFRMELVDQQVDKTLKKINELIAAATRVNAEREQREAGVNLPSFQFSAPINVTNQPNTNDNQQGASVSGINDVNTTENRSENTNHTAPTDEGNQSRPDFHISIHEDDVWSAVMEEADNGPHELEDEVQRKEEQNRKLEKKILIRKIADQYAAKSQLMYESMQAIEEQIRSGRLETAKILCRKLRERADDVVEDCNSFCRAGGKSEQLMKIHTSLEVKYAEILNCLKSEYVPDEIEPASLRLKPIHIKEFNGNLQDWPEFSELFTSIVLNNRKLNDIQKMQYLKTSLVGDAANVVKQLKITGNNLAIAWSLLEHTYENKRDLVDKCLKTLMSQKKMTREDNCQYKHLLNTSRECYELLKDAKVTMEQVILHLLIQKLSFDAYERYESLLEGTSEMQTINHFFSFLETRVKVSRSSEERYHDRYQNKKFERYDRSNDKKDFNELCACCNEKHAVFKCEKFKKLAINDRVALVKDKSLCILCLGSKHNAASCQLKLTCRECNKKHNTLLHFKKEEFSAAAHNKAKSTTFKKSFMAVIEENDEEDDTKNIVCAVAEEMDNSGVLLATAQIRIKTENGWSEELCALIDQGSMASFISERAAIALNLKRKKSNISISGIGGAKPERTLGRVNLQFTARYPTQYTGKTSAIVLKKVTTLSPVALAKEKIKSCKEFNNLVLADPSLDNSLKIDIILGSDIYHSIIMHGVIKTQSTELVAQETQLGWVLSGVVKKNMSANNQISLIATIDELHESMQRFWEVEEVPEASPFTKEEEDCMNHYLTNTTRNENGRYVVSMPFNENIEELGNSRRNAIAQLLHQERKFVREPELHQRYIDFINEYIGMGHMVECNDSDIEKGYYLPHHAVMKESTTTKLRVVFDASRKTSTGISLNDCMMTGPKLQSDLVDIIMRFRLRKIAFTADIAKMYRQILISEDQQNYQRILWRENKAQNIKEYKLTTVTYGTSSAPYLAVKTLIDHAKSEREQFSEASECIEKDFYMDDLMGSCDNLEKAVQLQQQITEILANAGLPLRKWSSNEPRLLEIIPLEHQEGALTDGEASIATLGLRWYNFNDEFGFKMNAFKEAKRITKRVILSEITKMYDPLGLLAPFTILCKILMQKLWVAEIGWDDAVPKDIATEWENYKSQIPLLLQHRIDRWIKYESNTIIELHGFADASEAAYGATIYARVITNEDIFSNIITSKTRVAPIAKQSLPRLELCAALLLAKLMEQVSKALNIPIAAKYFYSDSEITLAWIKGSPRKWETFVGNRVAKIQALTEIGNWRYVNTKENPADIASRGMIPEELVKSSLWWHGPQWLLQKNIDLAPNNSFDTTMGMKKVFVGINLVNDESIISRFSTMNKAIRSIAYCKRFVNTCEKRRKGEKISNHGLSVDELAQAKMEIIKLCQKIHFEQDLEHLQEFKEVSQKSKLKMLYPFIDNHGILRVGGRLENSMLEYNRKHPIILPYKSHFTRLVIDSAHKQVLHGGNQLTTAQIRHEFWIIGCKRAVKAYIHSCVRCHRFKATAATQLMGNLPLDRTRSMVKPFSYTGTDFAGPILMRMSKNGRIKPIKGYIAIFICFSTRAVHIEAVTDLTAEAFIASFQRFIARRGNVLKLYSDNGGNFVKAQKILGIESEAALKDYNESIRTELANHSTKFYFNPPSAPWFGGLWERNIGSIKFHLKRTIGERVLTYEEMSTVLTQIEACLNSRPICKLNENPDELQILTPGHFLIGSAITAPVTQSLEHVKENRLSRWQLCERMRQGFWKNWSNDYISELQKRTKWFKKQDNLKEGDVVIIKDEINPPLRWPLARITKVFPGKDELVRVVEVTTGTKTYKRPVGKLSKLPIEDNFEEETAENEEKAEIKFKKSRKITIQPKNFPSFITIVLLLGLFSLAIASPVDSTAHSENFSVTKFHEETGIYYEKGENVNVLSGKWNILSVLDINLHKRNYDTIKETFYELEHICNIGVKTTVALSACEAMSKQIQQKIELVKQYDQLITIEARRKRVATLAWIGGGMALGWAVEKVQEFFKESNIKELETRTHKLEELLKQQTSILEMTESVTKNNIQILLSEITTVKNQTVIMFDHLDKVSKNAEMTERTVWIVSHLMLMINDHQESQNRILEILVNQDQKLKYDWIKVKQLQEQIELINDNIPKDVEILGNSMQEKIVNIYKYAATETTFMDNLLIISIEIPLTYRTSYESYTIVPVPLVKNNTFVWIDIKHEIVLTNAQNKTHIFVKRNDIKGPILKNENPIIFNFKAGMLHGIDTSEYELKTTKAMDIFRKINNNKILCITQKNITAKIKCNDMSHNVTISSKALITLGTNCSITTDSFLFNSLTFDQQHNNLVTMPNISQLGQFPEFKQANLAKVKFSETKALVDTNEIEKMIKSIAKNTMTPAMKNTPYYYLFWIVIAINTILLLLLVFLQIKKLFKISREN